MDIFYKEYNIILIAFLFSIFLSFLIILLSYILVYQQSDKEKISAYECGFQPFEDARNKFEVRFYLVAILFIVFDLEIMFLFPWCLSLKKYIFLFGYWSMFIFLIILTIGFVYEWCKGALDWE